MDVSFIHVLIELENMQSRTTKTDQEVGGSALQSLKDL